MASAAPQRVLGLFWQCHQITNMPCVAWGKGWGVMLRFPRAWATTSFIQSIAFITIITSINNIVIVNHNIISIVQGRAWSRPLEEHLPFHEYWSHSTSQVDLLLCKCTCPACNIYMHTSGSIEKKSGKVKSITSPSKCIVIDPQNFRWYGAALTLRVHLNPRPNGPNGPNSFAQETRWHQDGDQPTHPWEAGDLVKKWSISTPTEKEEDCPLLGCQQRRLNVTIWGFHMSWIDMSLIEGSLEVKLPTIWTVEKQRWEESEEKRSEERRCRCAKR